MLPKIETILSDKPIGTLVKLHRRRWDQLVVTLWRRMRQISLCLSNELLAKITTENKADWVPGELPFLTNLVLMSTSTFYLLRWFLPVFPATTRPAGFCHKVLKSYFKRAGCCDIKIGYHLRTFHLVLQTVLRSSHQFCLNTSKWTIQIA